MSAESREQGRGAGEIRSRRAFLPARAFRRQQTPPRDAPTYRAPLPGAAAARHVRQCCAMENEPRARRAAREPQCCGNSAEVRRSPAVERIRSCPPGQNLGRTRWRAAVMRSLCLCGVLTLLACFGRGEASAQDTAAEEAARRAMAIAQLPPDAAKVLFGRESTPAAGPAQAIGSYERGG